jgi:hypothetical protein
MDVRRTTGRWLVGRGDRRSVRWKRDRRRKKKAREQRIAEAKGATRK